MLIKDQSGRIANRHLTYTAVKKSVTEYRLL